jgi:hypothetical protein
MQDKPTPRPRVTVHPNNVMVHGASEPLLTFLELGGFELRDLFLIGSGRNSGAIIVGSQERALAVKAALEPAYAVTVKRVPTGWKADFDRRDLDGTVLSGFLTDITLTDGTQVMRDGRWLT